jgi:endonuclease-3
MTRKNDGNSPANIVLDILEKTHPDAKIELVFSNTLELLIATILSAQCTDVQVNKVTPQLFKKYRSPDAYLKVPIEELENDIRPTGFFRNKARNIRGCCQKLLDEFDGKIPATIDDLTQLPGVGRKTANVILGNAFGIPGMVVDTHVKRISQRLGLTRHTDPVKIEADLCAVIPEARWTLAAHLFIFHGRRICFARKPDCRHCPLFNLCSWESKASDL